jgi:hypothetical protein
MLNIFLSSCAYLNCFLTESFSRAPTVLTTPANRAIVKTRVIAKCKNRKDAAIDGIAAGGKIGATKSGQWSPGLHAPAAAIMKVSPMTGSIAAAIAKE